LTADLGRTCRRWTNLCQKQDFWRLYAIKQWGQNIAPNQLVKNSTGSVEVDLSMHLIPTIQSKAVKIEILTEMHF
jgi:hypothetical protein